MIAGLRFPALFIRSLVVWAFLACMYLVLVGQGSTDELAAAGLTALAGAALSALVRSLSDQPITAGPMTVLRLTGGGVAAVPRDVLVVALRLLALHPGQGGTQVQPLQHRARTARGIEIMAISFAPNRFVIGLVQRDRALIHRLSS